MVEFEDCSMLSNFCLCLQRIACDLRYPDCYDNCGGETDAYKRPILPTMFHDFAACRCGDSSFASDADVNVKKRARHHADPAREHVGPKLHAGQTVKIIAQIKWDHRTEPKQENQLGALFADGVVDVAKLFVSFRDRFDFVPCDKTGDEKGQRRAERRANRDSEKAFP